LLAKTFDLQEWRHLIVHGRKSACKFETANFV
jgi:hypothetical protein